MREYNTDSIKFNNFGPHGRVELSESVDNIIIYRAYGPFNAELIKALNELEQPVLKERIKRQEKWVTLIEFKEDCIVTIEAKKRLYKYLEQCRRSGIIQLATAIVVKDDVRGKELAESIYGKCYQNVDVPFKMFKDYDSAVKWSIEQYKNYSGSKLQLD